MKMMEKNQSLDESERLTDREFVVDLELLGIFLYTAYLRFDESECVVHNNC